MLSIKSGNTKDSSQTQNEGTIRISSEPVMGTQSANVKNIPEECCGDAKLHLVDIGRKSSSLPISIICSGFNTQNNQVLSQDLENSETENVMFDEELKNEAIANIDHESNGAKMEFFSLHPVNEKLQLHENASTAVLLRTPQNSNAALHATQGFSISCAKTCQNPDLEPCRHSESSCDCDKCKTFAFNSMPKATQSDNEVQLQTLMYSESQTTKNQSTRTSNNAIECPGHRCKESKTCKLGPFAGPSGGAIPKTHKRQIRSHQKQHSGASSSDE